MHGEIWRFLFLQAHRETAAHIIATGLPSKVGRQSKVGLAAAKAAALQINLKVDGCGIVAAPVHAPSRAPLPLSLLLSHNLPSPAFTSA